MVIIINYMKSLYKDGFIPGPEESEIEFYERVKCVKKILENPKKYLPFKGPMKPLNGATLSLPSKNFPFHASSTLIVEVAGVTLSIIKEPSGLSSHFVSRQEVINHELVHAKRAMFNEPKFEEMIAYQTSSSKLRKTLSPIVNSTQETLVFILLAFLIPFSPLPFITYFSYLSIRLWKKTMTFNKCIKQLKLSSPGNEKFIEGMTDKEIILVASKGVEKLNTSSFRWKFLQEVYEE